MDNYKRMIDSLIQELEEEYKSDHLNTTKALNYEYIQGKLHGLYDMAKVTLDLDSFISLLEYRDITLKHISSRFNLEIIKPIYVAIEGFPA